MLCWVTLVAGFIRFRDDSEETGYKLLLPSDFSSRLYILLAIKSNKLSPKQNMLSSFEDVVYGTLV